MKVNEMKKSNYHSTTVFPHLMFSLLLFHCFSELSSIHPNFRMPSQKLKFSSLQ